MFSKYTISASCPVAVASSTGVASIVPGADTIPVLCYLSGCIWASVLSV
jgi:hypothetical protein